MKIVIVDDHVLFREGLMSLLRSQSGFEVVGEAGTVREAIEITNREHPDLVLMDFSLPDGTGLDATEAILAGTPGCKIVFLTIYETEEKLFEAIRRGAKGYLLKDMSISKLLLSLQALERGEPALTRTMMTRIMEEFARTEKPFEDKTQPFSKLSQREIEVLREVASGASNQEIAQRLFLSQNTVKHHIHNILQKLALENRRQLTIYYRQHTQKNRS